MLPILTPVALLFWYLQASNWKYRFHSHHRVSNRNWEPIKRRKKCENLAHVNESIHKHDVCIMNCNKIERSLFKRCSEQQTYRCLSKTNCPLTKQKWCAVIPSTVTFLPNSKGISSLERHKIHSATVSSHSSNELYNGSSSSSLLKKNEIRWVVHYVLLKTNTLNHN